MVRPKKGSCDCERSMDTKPVCRVKMRSNHAVRAALRCFEGASR